MNEHRPSGAAIEVNRLRKIYPGGVEAVKGVDFQVARGGVFGLIGPNGAGKSTTIGMLTTTIPSGGSARLAGFDVAREPLAARHVSSVVFQDPVVDRGLSGRRHLDLHARLWGVDPAAARGRAAELAGALGLGGELLERPVGSYSGGQRRRLEIARALVSGPQVLFLDEPTVGLDPLIRHELLDVLGRLRADGEMTILLTTHYLDEAERLCDRVAIMHAGELVALDSPSALLAGLGREILELQVNGDGPATLASLQARGIAGKDAFTVGTTLTVPLHRQSAAEAIAAIGDLRRSAAISSRRPTLDDVYLRLTGARLSEAA
jgi:ABC-2 type transport system ATP-binding protein